MQSNIQMKNFFNTKSIQELTQRLIWPFAGSYQKGEETSQYRIEADAGIEKWSRSKIDQVIFVS